MNNTGKKLEIYGIQEIPYFPYSPSLLEWIAVALFFIALGLICWNFFSNKVRRKNIANTEKLLKAEIANAERIIKEENSAEADFKALVFGISKSLKVFFNDNFRQSITALGAADLKAFKSGLEEKQLKDKEQKGKDTTLMNEYLELLIRIEDCKYGSRLLAEDASSIVTDMKSLINKPARHK